MEREFMTNASVGMVYLPFENITDNVDFNKRFSVEIPRHFDYFDQVYLSVDLPGFDEQFEYAWVPNVGFELIKSCELEVGGSQISRLTSDAMLIDNIVNQQKEMYDKCIGNVLQLTTPSCTKSSYRLNIPLQFDIPVMLAALQYHIVRVRIQLSPIEKLLVSNDPLPDLHLSNVKLLIKGIRFDNNEVITLDGENFGTRYNLARNTPRDYIVTQIHNYNEPLSLSLFTGCPVANLQCPHLPIHYVAWVYEGDDGKVIADSTEVFITHQDGTKETIKNCVYETMDYTCYAVKFDNAKRIMDMTFRTTFSGNAKPATIRFYVKVQNIFRNDTGMGGMAYVV